MSKKKHEEENIINEQEKTAPSADFLSKISSAPASAQNAESAKPQKTSKKRLSKREIIIIAVSVAVLVLSVAGVISFMLSGAKTPPSAISTALKAGKAADVAEVDVPIALMGFEDGSSRYVYIYTNGSDIYFTVLYQDWRGYTAKENFLVLPKSSKEVNPWLSMTLESGEKLIGGILTDKEASSVKVGGQPVILIDNGSLRCWFYIGDINISSSSVVFN